MSALLDSALTRPLLESLDALADGYGVVRARSEALIAALISGDIDAVPAAVEAQLAALAVVESAELRRRDAESAIVAALYDGDAPDRPASITASELLAMLNEPDAEALAQARRRLLNALIYAQAANRQAAVLLYGANAALHRLAAAAAPRAAEYGPAGQRTPPRRDDRRRAARLA